jgi:hypothetical protein
VLNFIEKIGHTLSADDNLDKSRSKGEKIHNNRKADKDGVVSHVLADEYRYAFNVIWNSDYPKVL